MKRLIYIIPVILFASSQLFSAGWWEMRQWDKKMEKLAEHGDEGAIDREEAMLKVKLREAIPDSKEAELIKDKLSKINNYRVAE